MAANAVASTSRAASDGSSDEEDEAARKQRKKDAKRARRQKQAQEDAANELLEEAHELARENKRRAKEQAELASRKKRSPTKSNKATRHASSSDSNNGIEIVSDDEVVEEERRVERRRKKAKLMDEKEGKGKQKEQKKSKQRGRAPVAQDDLSSEEESLVAVSKRQSLSREQSKERSAPLSRANSLDRSANRPKAIAVAFKPSSKLPTSSKPGSKSSSSITPSTMPRAKSTSKRPSLQIDTAEPRLPSASSSTLRDSAQSPPLPLSPDKTSTSSRRISLSNSSSTAKDAAANPPRPAPLRVWTPTGARDVGLPLQLSLDFDFVLPSRKGKEKEELVPAKLEGLAEVNALLEFAFARRKLGSWSSIEVERSRRDGGKGPWLVTVSLVAPGRDSLKIVEVTASAKPSVGQAATASEKEADQAELGGKMEIIRAIVKPSSQAADFLALIDPQLASQPSMDMGFADSDDDEDSPPTEPESKETADARRDAEGKELFRLFKTMHPRRDLASIERRLKSVGDLEFAETCKELLDTLEKGVVDLGDGAKLGFGRWTGDMAASLKLALGHIHRFCMVPHHAYLDLSISTVSSILDLAMGADAGADAESWINTWLQRLETDNEQVEADYARRGIAKPTPRSLPPPPKRIPAPQLSPPPIVTPVMSPALDPPTKRARQDEPSVDPRAAAKRQRLGMAQSAPPPAVPSPSLPPQPAPGVVPSTSAPPPSTHAADSPSQQRPSASPAPTCQPAASLTVTLKAAEIKKEAMSTSLAARRSTMSPIVTRAPVSATRASPGLTRASPSATRASPSITRTSPSISRGSPLTTRATPTISRPTSFHATSYTSAIPQTRPAARPVSTVVSISRAQGRQAPTPEPTPEAETRSVSTGPVFFERDEVLLESQSIADGRSLVQFSFDLSDEVTLARLTELNRDDNSLELAQLPLRAKVVFRRTIDDEAAWPSISINFNSVLVPLATTSLTAGSRIVSSHSFDITRLVRQGVNTLTLARWKTDHLPDDLRLSVELYRAISESWLRANLEEDDRVFQLYSDRAAEAAVPVGVSIIDPISQQRIVTPVRAKSCLHLEAFDLEPYLLTNLQQELSNWTCPRSDCGVDAPPSSLVTCSWHAQALGSIDPGIDMLDVIRQEEEEAKPDLAVKEEMAMES